MAGGSRSCWRVGSAGRPDGLRALGTGEDKARSQSRRCWARDQGDDQMAAETAETAIIYKDQRPDIWCAYFECPGFDMVDSEK